MLFVAFGIGMIANINLYIRMSSSDSPTVKERKVNEDPEVQNDEEKEVFSAQLRILFKILVKRSKRQ
jgi:hypothetical protein